MTSTTYDEAWLQSTLYNHPECLPVAELEPGFGQLVSICRELPTEHGPIDNLLMTPQGDIVLVEAKLWRNPQMRREVVAQALDYATCVFRWDYEALEQAVLRTEDARRNRNRTLYGMLGNEAVATEEAFIDAVNRNLKRGRALILVVGDGIRSETERLAGLLQTHAGQHFTFGLVELAVYRSPATDSTLIVPRTLAKTVMIERGIVSIAPDGLVVSAPNQMQMSGSISSEHFLESMASLHPALPHELKGIIARMEALGVLVEFKKSMNIKHVLPSGRTINLGYIKRNGELWTDLVNPELSRAAGLGYLEQIAGILDGQLERTGSGPNLHVKVNGRIPRVHLLIDRLRHWPEAVYCFLWHLEHLPDE